MNDNVDYAAPAELFPAPSRRRGKLHYHRFAALAEAVRFARETLTADERAGAIIEADEVRYTGAEIDALYEASAYPLPRTAEQSH